MSGPGLPGRGAGPGRGSVVGMDSAPTTGKGFARARATASRSATRLAIDTTRSASECSI